MQYTAITMDNDSAIDVTPMTNMDNRDGVLHLIDFVENPIIPDADAPSSTARQGQAPRRSWTLP
jgi:hypothetical protein